MSFSAVVSPVVAGSARSHRRKSYHRRCCAGSSNTSEYCTIALLPPAIPAEGEPCVMSDFMSDPAGASRVTSPFASRVDVAVCS